MALIKTASEIAVLRECGRIHAEVMEAVVTRVAPGISTNSLNDFIHKEITGRGDTPSLLHFQPEFADRPFPASSCISVNEEVVHGIPNENDRILAVGDVVTIDFGLQHKGAYTDMAVTVPVGKIDLVAKKLLLITKEALMAGIKQARPGGHVGDIGNAIEKIVRKARFGLVEELCGHGVGSSAHEEPFVPNYGQKGQGLLLRPGMVLAIEPIVNEGSGRIVLLPDGYTYRTADKKRSAHFEHTVLIGEDGPEILTSL